MADEELWKRRFQMFVLVRLIGMATFALGVVIGYTDLLRPGGWPLVGLIVAIVGAVDALFAPRMLKKVWEQQDREQE
jgi:membrane protein implicated in regulation of membrane protease activity